jgi:hypothetical protein
VFRNRPVSLALVGLFAWVTGCTSYTQIEPGEVADHGKVRVSLTNGVRWTIHDPRVDADSIKGKNARPIPLDQVAELEAVGNDGVATVLTIAGLFVGVLLMAGVAECAEPGNFC